MWPPRPIRPVPFSPFFFSPCRSHRLQPTNDVWMGLSMAFRVLHPLLLYFIFSFSPAGELSAQFHNPRTPRPTPVGTCSRSSPPCRSGAGVPGRPRFQPRRKTSIHARRGERGGGFPIARTSGPSDPAEREDLRLDRPARSGTLCRFLAAGSWNDGPRMKRMMEKRALALQLPRTRGIVGTRPGCSLPLRVRMRDCTQRGLSGGCSRSRATQRGGGGAGRAR